MAKSIAASSIAVRSVALCVLAAASFYAHAQQPLDSEVWKQRCLDLSAQSEAIDSNSASPELMRTTRGVAGGKFAAVGYERAHAGQHYIACTMYFTAAMAEHAGNGGRHDHLRAHTDVVLAKSELREADGQPLSFKQEVERTTKKASPLGKELKPEDLRVIYLGFGDTVGQPAALPPPEPGQEPNLHVASPAPSLKPGEQPNPFAAGQEAGPDTEQQSKAATGDLGSLPEPAPKPDAATTAAPASPTPPLPQPNPATTSPSPVPPPAASPQAPAPDPQEAKPQEVTPQAATPQTPPSPGIER